MTAAKICIKRKAQLARVDSVVFSHFRNAAVKHGSLSQCRTQKQKLCIILRKDRQTAFPLFVKIIKRFKRLPIQARRGKNAVQPCRDRYFDSVLLCRLRQPFHTVIAVQKHYCFILIHKRVRCVKFACHLSL